jgi:hypothetical protein
MAFALARTDESRVGTRCWKPAVSAAIAVLVAAPAATAPAAHGDAVARARSRAKTRKAWAKAVPALTAAAVDSAHVRLQWSAAPTATAYQVFRNGTFLGQVAAPTTTYADALLWPRTTYSYEVDPLTVAGPRLSPMKAQATTAPLPATGFARPFGATSVWNTPVATTTPAPNADNLGAWFRAHIVNPNMTLHAWGVAVAEARPTDTGIFVPCTFYLDCTLGALGSVPMPATAAADPASDGHLAVVDPATNHEWDMWQARKTGGTWSASAGAAVDMSGNAVAPAGTAGGDAANFPLLGGLVRPEEILQGHIDHALVFGMPGVSDQGHVCPATHHDGSTADPSALEEGTRLQLDPSVNVDALPIPQWQKTIARALQTYGMYLRDQGGSLAIWAENPVARDYDAWAKVGLSGDSISLAGIPWSKMRVLAPPC